MSTGHFSPENLPSDRGGSDEIDVTSKLLQSLHVIIREIVSVDSIEEVGAEILI